MALGHWLKDYIGPHSGGSGGGGVEPLIVNGDGLALDKTWQEIQNAVMDGRNVLLETTAFGHSVYFATGVTENEVPGQQDFRVHFVNDVTYIATSADGYPSHSD